MSSKPKRFALVGTLAAGILFAGPCGITTLQFQDFWRSTLIRSAVTIVAAAVETASIDQEPDVGG
jgi:hypothetical protein